MEKVIVTLVLMLAIATPAMASEYCTNMSIIAEAIMTARQDGKGKAYIKGFFRDSVEKNVEGKEDIAYTTKMIMAVTEKAFTFKVFKADAEKNKGAEEFGRSFLAACESWQSK